MNFLCVDIGTTSVKVGIISDSGEVVSFCSKKLDFSQKGFIALEWIKVFVQACEELNLKNTKIESICVSGNGPTICAQNGKTLLWNEEVEFLNIQTKSLFIPRILAFKNKYKSDFEKSNKIYSGPEFFVFCLTDLSVTFLPEERFLPAYWTVSELEKFDISVKKIPDFVKTGSVVGNLNKKFAEILGLSYDVKIVAGAPDFVVALIGTNTLSPGAICDRSGSSEGINFCSPVPVFCDGVRTLPSVIPGLWNLSVLIEKSGSLIDDFKNQIEKIENKNISYKEIIDFAFEDKNSEGWRILSVLGEEVFNAVKTIREVAKKNNLPINDFMTVTGGQANSEKWLLKKSAESKINLAIPRFFHSELLGDAVLSLVALNKSENLNTAANKICKIQKVIKCAEENTKSSYKIYKIPQNLKTIIFDIDSTLYTSPRYAFEQVDIQIRHIAKEKNIEPYILRNEISEFRKNWKMKNGTKISLGNTLLHFGVPIEKSIQMRENLLEPKNFLQKDLRLRETILKLKEKFNLICVTNNPVLPAKKTLEALGILDLIPNVVGLDTCKKSKPAREPFDLASKITNSEYNEILSVGDRFDMDLSLPLQMGMGGILVSGVKDVYQLPQILIEKK